MIESERYMEINGAELYVARMGMDHARTIVFLHGGPGLGDSRADIATFEPLAKDFHLVFLDLRGSGKSSETPPFTHEQWVEDIEQLRSSLGLGKIILHGSSYGGFLAQEYAACYSANLEYLLLNVTTLDGTNDLKAIDNAKASDRCQLADEDLQRLFSGKVESNEDFYRLYAGILPLYMTKFNAERDQQKLKQIHFHYETHNAAFRGLVHYDMSSKLPHIETPTLITAGELDWITPADCAKQIHTHMPNSALVIFHGSGHSLVREESSLYLDLVKAFTEGRVETANRIYDSRRVLHV